MARIIRFTQQDKIFINEYVHINMARYKEMVRRTFPKMTSVRKEMAGDFKKIFQDYELEHAVDMGYAIVYDYMLRRLRR